MHLLLLLVVATDTPPKRPQCAKTQTPRCCCRAHPARLPVNIPTRYSSPHCCPALRSFSPPKQPLGPPRRPAFPPCCQSKVQDTAAQEPRRVQESASCTSLKPSGKAVLAGVPRAVVLRLIWPRGFTSHPGQPHRAAPCPPAAPERHHHLWRCGSSDRPCLPSPLLPRCHHHQ